MYALSDSSDLSAVNVATRSGTPQLYTSNTLIKVGAEAAPDLHPP